MGFNSAFKGLNPDKHNTRTHCVHFFSI